MKQSALTLALVAIALVAPAVAQERVFEEPYWTRRPVIEALGRAELELPPNRASFSVSFIETDRDADDAMQGAVSRARIAYDAIKAVAGDSARVTTSVTVNAYYEQYRDRDGDRVQNIRPDKVEGYESTASVSVTVTEIALAGEARAAALALAPESSGNMRVYLERTADVNRQAYEAAVADAAARARSSAMAAGSSLGRLLVMQEGNGPCLGRWTSQPGRVVGKVDFTPTATRQQTVTVTGSRVSGVGFMSESPLLNVAGEAITQGNIDALNLPSDQPPQTVQAQVCAVYAAGP